MSSVVPRELSALVHYSLGRAVSATPVEAGVIGQDLIEAIQQELSASYQRGIDRGRTPVTIAGGGGSGSHTIGTGAAGGHGAH